MSRFEIIIVALIAWPLFALMHIARALVRFEQAIDKRP